MSSFYTARFLRRSGRRLSTLVTRDAHFASATESDVQHFRSVLGDANVVTGDDMSRYNRDWLGQYIGKSSVALRPRTTAEVSAVLRYCHQRNLAVVPHGGNTGLAGGSVPVHDEVVLSLQRMSDVVSIDADAGVATVQAGVTLQQLDNALAPHALCVPLDLGVKATCQLGGNVSTNAGGLRFIRYGSLHGSVVGLEVVLADGTVLDLLRSMRKDNTGLDLKQLFIGAEGTLGVVTAVAIAAPPRPNAVNVAFLGVKSWAAVLATLRRARSMLGEVLSAVEFEDSTCMRLVLQHLDGAVYPLTPGKQSPPFFMVIETAGSNGEHDMAKLSAFIAASTAAGDVVDASLASSSEHAEQLWRLRYGVSQALVKAGHVFKYDLSVPQAEMYNLVTQMRDRLAADEANGGLAHTVVGYGHVGDGNLHTNVLYDRHASQGQLARMQSVLEPWLFERVRDLRGSVSAEHGIGQHKVDALQYSKGPDARVLMRRVKDLLDPKGLLNPYKMLPPAA